MHTAERVSAAGSTTYCALFSVVIPGKWVKCSHLHPPSAELFRGVFEETANICSDLQMKRERVIFMAPCISNPNQKTSKD